MLNEQNHPFNNAYLLGVFYWSSCGVYFTIRTCFRRCYLANLYCFCDRI